MNFTINSFEAWGIINKETEAFFIKTSDDNYIEVKNSEIKDLRKLLDLVEDVFQEKAE